MKKRFVLALALALCLLAPSAMAAEEGALYVGGVALESGQYLGNDGTVSETEPEDGYAWYEDGVLTLKNYEYAGSGYCWTEEAGEESGSFSACVYADGPLHIQVEGGARLTCSETVNAKHWWMRPFVPSYLKRQQKLYLDDLRKELLK